MDKDMDFYDFFLMEDFFWPMPECDRNVLLRVNAMQLSIIRTLREVKPFGDRLWYRRYLHVRYCFAQRARFAYEEGRPEEFVPKDTGRLDLELLLRDLADMQIYAPRRSTVAIIEPHRSFSPVFLQQVEEVGLNSGFGARHLRGSPAQARQRWRDFSKAVARVPPDHLDRRRLGSGLDAASTWLAALVNEATRSRGQRPSIGHKGTTALFV